MDITGNPEDIRERARQVRVWADRVDTTGDQVRAGYGVRWVGVAADRCRERLAERAQSIDSSRDELRDLARSLDRLADALEERQAAIRRMTSLVGDVVDGARSTLGRLGSIATDLLSEGEKIAGNTARSVLDTVGDMFPPPGSPEWLSLGTMLRL